MDAFKPPRDRDAWAAILGFVYQVDLTIRRWLDLASDETLELECGEDIDLVSASSGFGDEEKERWLEQVKHRQKPITLVTAPVLSSLLPARLSIRGESEAQIAISVHYQCPRGEGAVQPPPISGHPGLGTAQDRHP